MSCDNVVINIIEPPDSNIDISIGGGGGGGGNAVWGSIFGTLSAQTDLWNALLSAGIQNLAYDAETQQLSITQGNTVILTPLVDDAFNRVIDYLEDNTINVGGLNITRDLFVGRDAYVARDLTVGGTIFTTTTATVLGTYFTTIGNGQDNTFTIAHNLSTKDISVVVRDLVTDTITYPAIQTPTLTSAVLSFSIVPQTSAYAVTVFGGVPSNRVAAYSLTFPKKPRANTLYVSLSGNDNNEGTLPEYPLRTIKKACEIAHNSFVDSFNNSNVKFTIFVGTGDFIEENPIYVPSNTSIIGDNLRRCSIIPKNKQFDILWVNTSVYVWGATFREHLEPSCATAFPDLENPLLTSIALKNLKTPFIRRTLNYDQAKCKRDVGYLLSAVRADIVSGNNSQSIINGQFYYNGAVSILPADQITPTVKAIQQTKTLTKFFTNTPTSSGSLSSIDVAFDTIIGIISGGVTNYTPINFIPSSDSNVAATKILTNTSNIQEGTLSFVNALYPTIYGWRKPFVTTSPYIQGCSSITKGLNSNLQSQVQQKYNNDTYPVATNSILSANYLFQTVIDIISGGPTNFTSVTGTPPSDAATAQALLTKSLTFIQDETVEYIDLLYNTFQYDEVKCRRDVGYILSAVQADIVTGNNNQAIYNGLKYYEGAVSVLPPEQIQPTIQAFQYTKALTLSAINNPTTLNSISSVNIVFNTIIDIISGGPSFAIPTSFIPSSDALQASILIGINTQDIKFKTTDYVNTLYNILKYNKAKCKRDVGFILNGIGTDLRNGNNKQSVINGKFYYNGVTSILPPDQIIPTAVALDRTRQAAIYALEGKAQLPSALDSISAVSTYFDTVITIVSSGPTAYPSITAERPLDAVKAVNLIEAGKSYIQDETVGYIDTFYSSFKYDEVKCRRDTGYILSAIRADIVNGNNYESIYNGLKYYEGAVSVLPSAQKIPTIQAFQYTKSLALCAINNPISINSLTSVSLVFDTIINIISGGPINAVSAVFTPSVDALEASIILEDNTESIKIQTTNYINNLYNVLNYDKEKCKRDVGYILSAVQADLKNGNNKQTLINGKFYYNGVTSVLPVDQIVPTVNALTRAKQATLYTLEGKGLNPAALDSLTAINAYFDTVISIVSSGPTAYPSITAERPLDAIKAAKLIEIAKPSIQKGTVTYVNSVYPSLSYSQTKCYRDVGYILSAIQFDLLKGNNEQSLYNGQQYYSGVITPISVLPLDQKIPTVAALVEAKKLTQQTLIGNYTYNPSLSVDYGPVAAPNVITNIETCIKTINDIITKGYNSYTIETFTPTADTDRAVELLQLHTPYIQEKTVEFVDKEYPYLNYNKNLCYRDVGLILSGIETDLKNGNNLESIRSGQAYYTGVITPASILPQNQIIPTTRAITEAGDLASYVVAGNYTKFTNINKTIDTINDIIFNGPNTVSAITFTPEPGALYAAQYLELNKELIQKEVTGYIKAVYPNLNYNKTKCERDVGFILSAIQFDIQAGSNSQGIINGNAYYYGTNQSYLPADQKVPTIMAFNYIGRLASFISQNTPIEGIPAGGGMRVDGSDAEGFLRSFVLDSYTQFNEGGKGIYILNNGYAQLVSIFTICCSEGVLCESGGSCSINTSNCSFGLSGLVARGKSPTPVLSGTLVNNPFRTNQILVNNVNGIQIYPNSTYYNPQSPIDTRQIAYTPYNGLVFTIGTDPTLYSIDNNPELVENSTDTYSITLANNLNRNFTPGDPIYFYIRSTLTTSSHTFEYIGSGTVLAESVPALGGVSDPTREAVFGDGGVVFFTSTNQAGNFRVGTDFTILQATGTIEGDTFKRSILTLVTPLTLALE